MITGVLAIVAMHAKVGKLAMQLSVADYYLLVVSKDTLKKSSILLSGSDVGKPVQDRKQVQSIMHRREMVWLLDW